MTMLTAANPAEVRLADGSAADLGTLDHSELLQLQWEQEREFARRIHESPKGSQDRREIVAKAYDTVTAIFGAAHGRSRGPLVMGVHPRHGRMVRHLLRRQAARGIDPRFFEIGYAAGSLLREVSRWGYPVAGIEVSAAMRDQACKLLGMNHQPDMLLGDFLHQGFDDGVRYSLIYWNDVFEHVPTDEIGDYLEKIHGLLVPGGQLVTITPNWHIRPSDVTAAVCPPRTEPAGLHLREYSLRDVTLLLRKAGFRRVAVPLCVVPSRMVLFGSGLGRLKRLLEPCLEWLPFPLARLLCRGLALNCTIATKAAPAE